MRRLMRRRGIGWFFAVLTVVLINTSCAPPMQIVETGTEEVVVRQNDTDRESTYVERETVRVNNCGGPAPVTQHKEFSRALTHEVVVELGTAGGASAGFNVSVIVATIKAEYEARFGWKSGSMETRTDGIDITAPPNSTVVYVLEWKEVWIVGEVVSTKDETKRVPYRVRKDVSLEIVSAREESCP